MVRRTHRSAVLMQVQCNCDKYETLLAAARSLADELVELREEVARLQEENLRLLVVDVEEIPE